MNELMIMQGVTLANKELKKATDNIIKAGNKIGNAKLDIALQLKKIETENLFVEDDFKNACDYAMQVFGMSKTTAYDLLNVGMFLDVETKKCVLPIATTEWSHTQLQALTPLKSVEVAEILIYEERVNSDMSVRDIKREVEEYLHGDEETEEETDEPIDGAGDEVSTKDILHTFKVEVLDDETTVFYMDDEEIDKATAIEFMLKLSTAI